ncbi:phosphatidylglycerophosphatase A family protein [Nitratifractor sp.]
MKVTEAIVTLFGLGRLPAPSVSATVIVWALGTLLAARLGIQPFSTLTVALLIVGIFEVNKYENRGGSHDDPAIVLDEAVGVLTALCVSESGLLWLPDFPYAPWLLALGALGGFLLFRLWHPSTIGWIRRTLHGGLGVMLDDFLAGFAGGALVLVTTKILLSISGGA